VEVEVVAVTGIQVVEVVVAVAEVRVGAAGLLLVPLEFNIINYINYNYNNNNNTIGIYIHIGI